MKKTLKRFAPVALVFVALATLSFMAKISISLRLRPEQDHLLKSKYDDDDGSTRPIHEHIAINGNQAIIHRKECH